jgi:hypothetical protein
VFLGYRARPLAPPPPGACPPHVEWLASVSHCLARPPESYFGRDDTNAAGADDSPEAALAAVNAEERPGCRLFAYAVVPVVFDRDGERPPAPGDLWLEGWPDPPPGPALPDLAPIGYDVASRQPGTLGFGCSPLTCNGLAASFPVNRFGLVDALDDARRLATHCGATEPEPGPYVIVQVLLRDPPPYATAERTAT